MADEKLVKITCQKCRKKISVRPDQFGRRLRCPACQSPFRVDLPSQAEAKPDATSHRSSPPPPSSEPEEELFAAEAGELILPGSPRRATARARFYQPPEVVFEAVLFAIRQVGGEIITLDRVNLHVRFAAVSYGYANEYGVYVFPTPRGGSEIDIRSVSPGGRADELLYSRIGAELAAYLGDSHAYTRADARRASLSLMPAEPRSPRSQPNRRGESVDAFTISGLVVSALGLVLFCIPIAAIPLGAVGAVLSLVALTQQKSRSGLTIAGLVVGILAIILSGVVFLVFLAIELEREERGRKHFGVLSSLPRWEVTAEVPKPSLQLIPIA